MAVPTTMAVNQAPTNDVLVLTKSIVQHQSKTNLYINYKMLWVIVRP